MYDGGDGLGDQELRYIHWLEKTLAPKPADQVAHYIMMTLLCLFALGGVTLAVAAFVSGGQLVGAPGIVTVGAPFWLLWKDREKRQQREQVVDIAYRSVAVPCKIVQANHLLFQPGPKNQWLACLALLTFDKKRANDAGDLEAIAQRLYHLKTVDPATLPASPEGQALLWARQILFASDDRAVLYRRVRLPDVLTGGGAPVYAVDVFLPRHYLREGYLGRDGRSERLWCMAERGEQGRIEVIPWDLVS